MNRTELFESLMKEFQKKASEMLEEAAGKIVVEYLPHIETDTEWNAEHMARELVQDLISGVKSWRTESVVLGVNSEKVRKAIFENYRAELEQGLIADLQHEIDCLKNELEFERTARYW